MSKPTCHIVGVCLWVDCHGAAADDAACHFVSHTLPLLPLPLVLLLLLLLLLLLPTMHTWASSVQGY
jgi:hypothetical protein